MSSHQNGNSHPPVFYAMIATAVAVVGVLYLFLWFSWALHAPLSSVPLRLEVKRGETLGAVLGQMPPESMAMKWLPIRVYARFKGIERQIHYGRYLLPADASAIDLLKMLKEGRALLVKVTVLPGSTLTDIARVLDSAQVVRGSDFLGLAGDTEHSSQMRQRVFGVDVGEGNLEGYLYPDTYRFSANSDPFTVAFTMVNNLARHLPADWMGQCKRLGLSLHQVLTIASIVEKETYLKREMPLIAEVFLRRLKLGMKLQADPTVIYAVEKSKGSRPNRLRWKDLRVNSPYNTYVVNGLPPGPICSPSGDAIYAVLHPANTKYLYFVATGTGGHKFSTTLREHINAVNRYQRR